MELFRDLLLILSGATLCGLGAHYLGLPHLAGFMIAGVIMGPAGLGLLKGSEQIHLWSEVGIVLLLLTIGLELSPAHMKTYRGILLKGAPLQMGSVVAVLSLLLPLFGVPFKEAFLWGLILSMSSTAVALSLLQGRNELDAPQGRLSLAILLFQDIMVVPFMLIIPLLAGGRPSGDGEVLFFFLRLSAILGAMYLLARYGLPLALDFLASRRNRELFFLGVLVIILAISGAMYLAGLSLALGAFLAGFLISRSSYHSQILSEIEPFRDLLLCIFFVSVGLMVEPGSFGLPSLMKIVPLTLGIVTLKASTAFLAAKLLGYPWRTALLTSVLLFQVGEFSLVLAGEGLRHGLLAASQYQLVVSSALLSIILTPIIYPFLYRKTLRYRSLPFVKSPESPLEGHLVIVGYGPVGRQIANAALRANIPYVVIELNPITVKQERRKGIPIIFGDATRDRILQRAGVPKARAVAVTVPDAASVRRIVALARRLNPWAYIVARSRYAAEKEALTSLGADEVVIEEITASTEIFRHLMQRFDLAPAFAREIIEACQGSDGPLPPPGPPDGGP